jgi:hypothetical protein
MASNIRFMEVEEVLGYANLANQGGVGFIGRCNRSGVQVVVFEDNHDGWFTNGAGNAPISVFERIPWAMDRYCNCKHEHQLDPAAQG